MRTATTKVRREEYRLFDSLCREQGKTPYSVLQDLLFEWMAAQIETRLGGGG